MRTRKVLGPAVLLGLLAACGKHYWESPGRGVAEFRADSADCIKEATVKYALTSEQLYRACMKAHGWIRVQSVVA